MRPLMSQPHFVIPFPQNIWDWTYDKVRIGELTGLPDDALHINAGMLILVLAALALRRWPWHWSAWLVVLVAETANEAYDLLQPYYPADEGNIRASLHDLWLTMLWPTIILVTFPLFARLWAKRRAFSPQEGSGESPDVRPDIGA
jgi:hypothetical protein